MLDFDLKIRTSLHEDQVKLRSLSSQGTVEAATACLVQALRLLSLAGVADLKQRALRINSEALGDQVQKSTARMISALIPGVVQGVLEETGHGDDTGNVP